MKKNDLKKHYASSIQKFVSLALCASASSAICSSTVLGQSLSTPKLSVLPSLKIQETRDENSVAQEKIDKKQDKNLSEVFKHSPDVTVGGNQNSNQKLYLRGLEENNLNITLDGTRQNQNIFHHQGSLNIDPELLKLANIEAGTGSASSGPGALGGRVEFETKDARDFLTEGQSYGFLLKSEYSTNAEETRLALAGFARLSDRADALIYLNGSNYSNFRAGGGEKMLYTAGEPRGDLIKLNYFASNHQKWTVVRSHREDSALRYLRGNFGVSGGTTVTDQQLLSESYSLSFEESELEPFQDLNKKTRRKWNLHFAQNDLISQSSTSKSHGSWENLGVDYKQTHVGSHERLNFGFDINQDKSINKSGSRVAETGFIGGIFGEFGRSVGDKHDFELGLRGDFYQLKQTNGLHHSQQRWNPSLIWRLRLDENWLAQASWKEAFKGVVPGEAFLLGGVKSVEEKSIEGSVSETTELKLRYQKTDMEIQTSLYDTIIENPLFMKVARNTGVLSRSNGGTVRSQGLSVNGKYNFNEWNGRASYSKNKMKYGAAPLGYTAFGVGSQFGDRWTLGLERNFYDRNMQVYWDVLLTDKMTDVASGQLAQPGYDVHDAGFVWQWTHQLKISAVVKNIFDRKYIAQGSVYSLNGDETVLFEPGRDLRGSLVYSY